VLTEAHTRLLASIYGFLRGPDGRIPEDFLARQVRELDRPEGDVDSLLARIAGIRTWTYLSNRDAWVPDARHWQERTRAVEDRLSDALHERLTQEFVDRRGTVIGRHEAGELVTTIGEDGEVAVQGLRAGVLEGFHFRAETSDRSRALQAAANRALRTLVPGRVQALEAEAHAAFALDARAEVLWRGAVVARLLAGESALAPRVEVLATDLLDAPLRERVRRRLAEWLDRHLQTSLAPLFTLRAEAPAGTARGLAFVIAEGLGAASRRALGPQVAALSHEDRRALSRLGVTIGRLAVFLASLQRPETIGLRGRLYAVGNGQPVEGVPDGAPSVARNAAWPPASYLACGYLPLGPRAVRIDRAEHAAAVASRLSQKGPFAPPRVLPGILGCSAADLPAVLADMGYVEREGRFERRRRASRPATPKRPAAR
jgi:ATP-dependent RNA helicase SUPV3L1/SUV3